MTMPQWLIDMKQKVEKTEKEAAQRHIEWQRAEEEKVKGQIERMTAQMTENNNGYICRAFGVTKDWCRSQGINM